MDRETIIIKEALSRYSRYETDEICKRVQAVESMPDSLKARLDKKISELLARVNKSFNFKKVITILIAATLIIACLSVAAYAVNERIKIGGFFVEWFDGHIKFTADDKASETVSLENVKINYIPEGFTLTEETKKSRYTTYKWNNGESSIIVEITIFKNGAGHFNTENNNFEILNIGDYEVFMAEYPSERCALWCVDKIEYYVDCSNIEREELIKIIEGISYEEQ